MNNSFVTQILGDDDDDFDSLAKSTVPIIHSHEDSMSSENYKYVLDMLKAKSGLSYSFVDEDRNTIDRTRSRGRLKSSPSILQEHIGKFSHILKKFVCTYMFVCLNGCPPVGGKVGFPSLWILPHV